MHRLPFREASVPTGATPSLCGCTGGPQGQRTISDVSGGDPVNNEHATNERYREHEREGHVVHALIVDRESQSASLASAGKNLHGLPLLLAMFRGEFLAQLVGVQGVLVRLFRQFMTRQMISLIMGGCSCGMRVRGKIMEFYPRR